MSVCEDLDKMFLFPHILVFKLKTSKRLKRIFITIRENENIWNSLSNFNNLPYLAYNQSEWPLVEVVCLGLPISSQKEPLVIWKATKCDQDSGLLYLEMKPCRRTPHILERKHCHSLLSKREKRKEYVMTHLFCKQGGSYSKFSRAKMIK